MLQDDLRNLKTEGFIHKKKLFAKSTCENIVQYLETKAAALNIPFSNVPWGYGNMINDPKLSLVYDNPYIKNVCSAVLEKDYEYNHLMVNNKAPWIGPGIEWHQEIFNADTYAPGGNTTDQSYQNFLQIYIALDDHTLENGCLKVIPGSHKLGLLPHENIVNHLLDHKRRIPYKKMHEIFNKCGMVNVIMNRGDVLFFGHRFVHGSASNNSQLNRKSIVMQARKKFERDEEIFKSETSFRRNFALDALKKKVAKLGGKNVYKDFVKGEQE